MKRVWLRGVTIGICAVCLMFGTNAYAASKFGIIDMGKVFNALEKTKNSDKVLEQEGQKKETERNAMIDEIKRLQDEMELMSEKGKEEKQAVIEEKRRKLATYERDAREELLRKRDVMAREIIEEIRLAVKQYAEQNDYAFIIEKGALVYGVDQADVSDKIATDLNAKYKSGKK